jgi:hypothetical protein
MFVAKNDEMVPVAKTRANEEMVPVANSRALYAPRHPFSEWVTCGNEIVRNHPKHEFWT